MKRLRAVLAALVTVAALTGASCLEKHGLEPGVSVECTKDGCTVSGHLHTKK